MAKITLEAGRINAGLTQADVSEKMGIGVATIINWEKGVTSPKISDALKLCDLYKLSLDDILWVKN